MKLSNNTRTILKNFAAINPNLVVEPGNEIKTISEAKNIMAIAKLTDTFDTQINVYDLNEFLAVYDMIATIEDPDVNIATDSIVVSAGNSKITYRQADKSVLTYPQKDIKMPVAELKVDVTEDDISKIKKAASVLGHNTMAIRSDRKSIFMDVFDPSDKSANRFTIDKSEQLSAEFEFHFLIANLKFIPGDYNVAISSKGISEWSHSSTDIRYFVGLEKTSTYNE